MQVFFCLKNCRCFSVIFYWLFNKNEACAIVREEIMYQKLLWSNGVRSIAGAIVNTVTGVSGRKKVDIQFEDGRWFNGVPEKALTLNVNWILLDAEVNQSEIDSWREKSANLPTLIYSVCLEMDAAVCWPKPASRKVVNVATVLAESQIAAEKAAIEHFGKSGTDVNVRYSKLSDCQIIGFCSDIIEAS